MMFATLPPNSPRPVRVRLAPSPTGNLHVGTARTALLNYLFAKHNNGTYILRIEDTDMERSTEAFTQNIFDGLRALSLPWDEGPDVGGNYGPYKQSERLHLYQPYAEQLLASGHAYWDYTNNEELEALRTAATEAKQPFVYRPAPLTPEQEAAYQADPTRKPSLRLRIPADRGTIVVNDLIRGEVQFDASTIGDFVIVKSDGMASFNFANVIDDALMAISHVIRGEDHLPNTPKHRLLYEALGFPVPAFAHLPMILAPDRSKLSKRHGATAVAQYIDEQGYLPEAFINFLALLGWSSPTGEELLSLEQLIEQFTLERVNHSGAIFDTDKLNWMNGQYLRALPLSELDAKLRPILEARFAPERYYNTEQWHLLLSVVRDSLVRLPDINALVGYFFGESVVIDADTFTNVLQNEESTPILQTALNEWLPSVDFGSVEGVQASLKVLTKQLLSQYKVKPIMWALRASCTGTVQGADLPTTLYLLGSQRVEHRLKEALHRLAV
ncbi:MAG: glutamate--tRNA ligase [Vampirovibrionales bacterium]